MRIDGSRGEGGGQILRSSLALATCLGRPFTIENIRSARSRPGLRPQHLAAVRAAAAISGARVEGDEKNSSRLSFTPGEVRAGEYVFSVGTAGSTTLVLQTVLPALMTAAGPSRLRIEGGTHNPFAPPYDFLRCSFLPLLNRMGPGVEARLEKPGFAPQGGGRLHVDIQPASELSVLEIPQRGAIRAQYAEVLLAHLPAHIARRELDVFAQELGYTGAQLRSTSLNNADGPGNVVSAFVESEQLSECFTAFGRRGLPAERVAGEVVRELKRYVRSGVPVGHYLADQLLLPMALAGGGMFLSQRPSSHTLTNIDVIKAFLEIDIKLSELAEDVWEIRLDGNAV